MTTDYKSICSVIQILHICVMVGCVLVAAVPVQREITPPPANSPACRDIYHGKCIDTYQFQCMGLAVPGVCGNISHFSAIDFGSLTVMQCCNGWMMPAVGSGAQVG